MRSAALRARTNSQVTESKEIGRSAGTVLAIPGQKMWQADCGNVAKKRVVGSADRKRTTGLATKLNLIKSNKN